MDTKNDIDIRIVDFLTGSTDAETIRALEEWVRSSRENRDYFFFQCECWIAAIDADSAARYDAEKAFEQFKLRTGIHGRSRRLSPWVPWVAAAAITVIASVFAFHTGKKAVQDRFADIVVEVPLGGKTHMTLPDGTVAWLNAGSRLTYSQGFGVSNRSLSLSGEGYFEVTKNKDLPFYIASEDLAIRVTGTQFNFRDYPEDPEAVVSLVEGRVILHNRIADAGEVALRPGDKAYLDKSLHQLRLERARTRDSAAWTRDILLFDEETLANIVAILERTYDVNIEIMDERLASYRFYGSFYAREMSVEDILSALQSTCKIRFRTEGQTIILY